MRIKRELEDLISSKLSSGKIIIIYGPRQSGKTTLIKMLLEGTKEKALFLNGDEYDIRNTLSDTNTSEIRRILGNCTLLVIDEAQRIKNIGVTLKIIADNFPDVKVLASGSSSFDLANKISEPLTGRKLEYLVLPFSFGELSDEFGYIEEKRNLSERMIYGSYPDIVLSPSSRTEYMHELTESYLYKDILVWNGINKPEKLHRLVKALALQLGSEVSYNELGTITGLDNETVEKYLDLLEKTYVVFRLPSFNRNMRNELKKGKKVYFYDNGIRNAVINNFGRLEDRSDTGALWENYIISERKKYLNFRKSHSNQYFWRTTTQQEIDYIEERQGQLNAYEIKWNPAKRVSFPRSFKTHYPEAVFQVINSSNYTDILLD